MIRFTGMKELNEDTLNTLLELCCRYPIIKGCIAFDDSQRLHRLIHYINRDHTITGRIRAFSECDSFVHIEFINGSSIDLYNLSCLRVSSLRGMRYSEVLYDGEYWDTARICLETLFEPSIRDYTQDRSYYYDIYAKGVWEGAGEFEFGKTLWHTTGTEERSKELDDFLSTFKILKK